MLNSLLGLKVHENPLASSFFVPVVQMAAVQRPEGQISASVGSGAWIAWANTSGSKFGLLGLSTALIPEQIGALASAAAPLVVRRLAVMRS